VVAEQVKAVARVAQVAQVAAEQGSRLRVAMPGQPIQVAVAAGVDKLLLRVLSIKQAAPAARASSS